MKPKIKLLPSVKINGAHLAEHVIRMLYAARDTAPEFTDGTLWVTSANDAKHREGSRHYTDEAFDLRTRNLRGDVGRMAREWVARMKAALGKDYDVIFEGDHVHTEYDPK